MVQKRGLAPPVEYFHTFTHQGSEFNSQMNMNLLFNIKKAKMYVAYLAAIHHTRYITDTLIRSLGQRDTVVLY